MAEKQSSEAAGVKQSTGIPRNISLLILAAVAVVSFVAGTRQHEIMSAVGPIIGMKVATGTLDTSSLQDTYRQLAINYDGELDSAELIEGAHRGMVEAVGDEHTVYMSAEEAEQFERDLSGDIGGGIGAEIGVRSDQPTILRTLEDTPAASSGLRAGDIIRMVNSTDVTGWNAEKTAGEIRGEVGTTVKIKVLRDREEHEFSITRARITNPSVESEIKDRVGVLTIRRFDSETVSSARRAAEEFKRRNVKGVIVDLRGNGGGYLSAAQDVASIWLSDKVIVSERRGDEVQQELRSRRSTILEGVPTVVLVDGTSASASEIVAGALQDYDAAHILGETTFGKGTVQKLVDLGRGAELKVTIARWYTPNGTNISREGIKPDQEVELSFDDVNDGKDPQMKAAMEHFNR